MKTNILFNAVVLSVATASSYQLFAQEVEHDDHHKIEEVVVTGALLKTQKDTALPVNVLSDEQLRENAASTIGETLQNQIGVTSASFGPGVGQPVIRGQSANRVQVLQNGTGALDVSNTSQDHANAVEGLVAERIEVVRGPATLLYGNGAIGGVVNVIGNRIPDEVPEAMTGALEYRFNNVNQGSTVVAKADGGAGNIAWHLDGVFQDTDNTRIPGLSTLEEDHEEEEHDEHEGEEHEEEEEGTFGFIENSNTRKTNLVAGVSYVSDNGFIGVSINQLDNEYGLPPGAHGHEEHEEEGHEEEEEEVIRLDMEQTRIDIKAAYDLDSWVENIKATLTSNDYTHKELEGSEIGTIYDSQGLELRLSGRHQEFANGLIGSFGLQYVDRDFSAIGEEAFIPESNIQSVGAYVVESIDRGNMTYEAGLRFDRQEIDNALGCNSEETSVSSSLAAIWNFSDEANVLMSVNQSQRAPTIEELYSNVTVTGCDPSLVLPNPEILVTHAATGRIEIGDASLDKETATNFEIGFRKHSGYITGEVSAFINNVDDYVYLSDVGEIDETIVSSYLQQDARFIGVETSLNIPLRDSSDGSILDLELFGDYVEAELDDGRYLPRIPPLRFGFELTFAQEDWSLKLRDTIVHSQDKISANESTTDNYHRIDLYADYHWHVGDREVLLFAKGKNLTNQEIRNHTSFLKNFAPEAGRAVELGVRYNF